MSTQTNNQPVIRILQPQEAEVAQKFYQSVGYTLTVNSNDDFVGAFQNDEMIGIVRLARENSVVVLRGMQVRTDFQRGGVGTKMIKLLERVFQEKYPNQICYCLPHNWLESFYGQIGFKTVSNTSGVPQFLQDRLTETRKKYPHVILMKRD